MQAPSLPELLILGLATWRLTAMLSYERGPFGLFVRLRSLFEISPMSEDDPEPEMWPANSEIANLLVCPWCLSLWIGLAVAVLFLTFSGWAVIASLPFSLSAIVVIVERIAR